jgi:hypothetical protein
MAGVKLSPRLARAIALSVSLIVALGVWHWAEHILAPANAVTVLAARRPVGNNSDLYPRWLGARELLLFGRDPYSLEVTREIQKGFYGRVLDPRNPADPIAEESFVYPLYVVFLMAPTVKLPFAMVMSIFRWLLLLAIAGSVPLWMNSVGLRPSWPVLLASTLLAVSSFPAVEEYFQQNLAALVLLFLAAAAAAAVRGRLVLSGFLLALSTAKPDTTGLVILWFLLWAAAKRPERGRLIWSFAGSLTVLVAAGEMISPHWIGRFIGEVRRYAAYGTDPSILRVLLPRWLATLASVALLSTLVGVSWKWRRAPATSQEFGWALSWSAAVTLAVIPKLAAYNQLLLIPSLLMLIRLGNVPAFMPRALAKAAFACQGWQWLAATGLSIASLAATMPRLRATASLPLATLLALPLLTLLAVIAHSASELCTKKRRPRDESGAPCEM